MTRIETGENGNMREIEEKLSHMEKKLSKTRRGMFSCFNCLIYLLVIILVCAGLVAYYGAKSGLMQVPYVSERVFTAPTPKYIVPPVDEAATQASVMKELLRQAAPQIRAGKTEAVATLSFSDADLTRMLRSSMKNSLAAGDVLQVALYDGKAEIFLHKGARLYMKVVSTPTFTNKSLSFPVDEAMLGNVSLPKSIATTLLNVLIGGSVAGINNTLKAFGSITDITVLDGELRVQFLITKTSTIFNAL